MDPIARIDSHAPALPPVDAAWRTSGPDRDRRRRERQGERGRERRELDEPEEGDDDARPHVDVTA